MSIIIRKKLISSKDNAPFAELCIQKDEKINLFICKFHQTSYAFDIQQMKES